MTTRTNEAIATILLVEDDPGDQALTRRAFEDGKVGVDLRVVGDGSEALEYLNREGRYADPETSPRPDLVLLDLNLPGLDGKQVLERIRANEALKRIPVVALTTSEQEQDIVRSYDLGANSYITKPVDMGRFIETVRELGNYWFKVVVLPPRED